MSALIEWRAQLGPSIASFFKEENKAERHYLYLSSLYSKLHWFLVAWEKIYIQGDFEGTFIAWSSVGHKHGGFWAFGETEFCSGTLGSIMILCLVLLLCKPQQVELMFSLDHSSSSMWSKFMGGNSWGLRKPCVDFLYFATNISHVHSPIDSLSKQHFAPLIKATDFSF